MLDLAALDDAVIAQIRGQCPVFLVVDTLDTAELLYNDSAPAPSAHTLIGRLPFAPPVGNEHLQRGTVDVSVFVRARNLRGGGAARKDLGGAYELIAAVRDTLLGFTVFPCGPLYLAQINPVRVDRVAAIYEVALRADIEEEY